MIACRFWAGGSQRQILQTSAAVSTARGRPFPRFSLATQRFSPQRCFL